MNSIDKSNSNDALIVGAYWLIKVRSTIIVRPFYFTSKCEQQMPGLQLSLVVTAKCRVQFTRYNRAFGLRKCSSSTNNSPPDSKIDHDKVAAFICFRPSIIAQRKFTDPIAAPDTYCSNGNFYRRKGHGGRSLLLPSIFGE